MHRHLTAVAVVLLLAACGSREKTYEVETGDGGSASVAVKGDGEQVSIRSEDGEVVYQQGGQGAQFPAHAPQYPGSTVTSSAQFSANQGGASTTITQQTRDDMGRVLAFYKEKATAAGLKIMMETNTPESAMLIAGKDDSNESSVIINLTRDEDGSTSIALMSGQGR